MEYTSQTSLDYDGAMPRLVSYITATWILSTSVPHASAAHRYFKITVQDSATGVPISGVLLKTIHKVRMVTDANGVVAFYEPGLMANRVYFTVEKQGYQMPADGFGLRGQAFDVTEGGAGIIKLPRSIGPTGPDVTTTYESQLASGYVPEKNERFWVTVLDGRTGNPLPLAELRNGNNVWVTDSAGGIALHDLSLLGQTADFSLRSHGYEAQEGLRMTIRAGESTVLRLIPRNFAERLYRVTGGGIYADSTLLGLSTPTKSPLLAGLVLGQDSVQTTVYKGQIFWIWGDTNRPSYPLGNFRASGARSDLPSAGGLDPAIGVDLRYFVGADGFAKEMAPDRTVPGKGVTWLGGLLALSEEGKESLYATYGKYENLKPVEEGMLKYDDAQEVFVKLRAFGSSDLVRPSGHPFFAVHDTRRYVYYQNQVRIPAQGAALADPSVYESFTARKSDGSIDRTQEGAIRYEWRRGVTRITEDDVKAGLLRAEEALLNKGWDAATGEPLSFHENSDVEWNEFRGRYAGIFLQNFGKTSLVGEIYYAEGDTPMGPFVYGRKVVSHDVYNCYNPRHHPFFDQEGGRRIFFECSFTSIFTNLKELTPRYDYNQMMYRLKLDDPALALPVPVYALANGELRTKRDLRPWLASGALEASFLALDRAIPGTVAVGWSGPSCKPRFLSAAEPAEVLFYAFPSGSTARPAEVIPLYEYVNAMKDERVYTVHADWTEPGYVRTPIPLCYVWKNPLPVKFPVLDHLPTLIADAGEDACLSEEAPGEGASVVLQAGRSVHTAGAIREYRWSWVDGGPKEAVGATPKVHLSAGLHRITITAFGSDGKERSDDVLVSVQNQEAAGCACQTGQGGRPPMLPFLLFLSGLLRVVTLSKSKK